MGIPGAIADIQPFAELAQNATTQVYKAYQKSLERFVLLKRLRPELSSDEELARRFQEEARIVARVQHPNVVGIYSYGTDDEGTYIVAEFVEGLDLDEVIARGRVHPEIAVYILTECARGLKAAHDKEVLHRDIKPSNVLVSLEGEVKLADFGLASVIGSASDEAEIRGTLAYLAPEHILGKPVDKRSDLFSLGATFYEMLTGRRAFPGSTSSEIFDSILNREPLHYLPATPGVDAGIEAIVRRLLARDANDRYEDTGDLIEDLESWAARAGTANEAGQITRGDLVAYLNDPQAFSESRPAVPATVEPVVPAAPVERKTPSGRRGRRAALAAGVLFIVAALLYAGVALVDNNRSDRRDLALAADSLQIVETAGADSINLVEDVSDEAPSDEVGSEESEEDSSGVSSSDLPVSSESPAADPPVEPRTAEVSPPREEEIGKGHVELTIDIPAEVFVGETPVGRVVQNGKLVVELPEGSHAFTFKSPEYPAYRREVNVRAGETTAIEVSLRSLVGYLDLTVSPYARVFIDGRDYGETPFAAPIILVPGVHKLRLVHELADIDRTFDIRIVAGEELVKEYRLLDLQ